MIAVRTRGRVVAAVAGVGVAALEVSAVQLRRLVEDAVELPAAGVADAAAAVGAVRFRRPVRSPAVFVGGDGL